MNAKDLAFTKARYDGEIRYADYWVGRILDQVRQLGLDRTATIILLSDHGEEFQEHGSVQHDRLYTTVTRIPLLIRPPGGTEGTVIDTVVQALDLMPTLLDGAGIEAPSGLQGRSLMPLLRGETLRDLPAISESGPRPNYSLEDTPEGENYAEAQIQQSQSQAQDPVPGGQLGRVRERVAGPREHHGVVQLGGCGALEAAE